jgi:hypothetical protein
MAVLLAMLDGAALPKAQARALWERFSEWMQAHPGDLEGFAKSEGFKSVHPEMHAGVPVLNASHTEPQRAYAPAPKR